MKLYATLPNVCVGVAMVLLLAAPASAATILVRAGGDLQAALDAAQPGDVILLEAGATFHGNFTLPVKAGTGYITVRSSAADSELPAAGVRITPAVAPLLPKIQSPNTSAALRTAPGAHHWRLQFLEFGANQYGYGDILQIGDGSSAQYLLSQVPYEIDVDRVYIHGDPVAGQKRGIALNGRAVTIRNCHIGDIKFSGQDSQAIGGWNGPGPYLIENNFLEASAENVLLGGADPAIPNLVTEDVVVRRNHVYKPLAWRGTSWQVKNLFELKNARRVVVEYNVFENNWAAAQPGYAILFTPRNQDGGCPWCVVEDVTFQYNIVRNTGGVFNITGYDDLNVSAQTSRIQIRNNLVYGVSTQFGRGWFMLIGNGPRDIVVDHNTIDHDGTTAVYAHGGTATAPMQIVGFQLTSNAMRHNAYGINGANFSYGNSAINAYFPGGIVLGNWLEGGPASRYPAGNLFTAGYAAAFVDVPAKDYRIADGSLLIGTAADAGTIGADINGLLTGLAGVSPDMPAAPVQPAPTEPAPTEPAPTEPAPTEPAPTEPVPTEPVTTEPPPPPAITAPEIVLYAANATIVGSAWTLEADAKAAGGARAGTSDRGMKNVAPLAAPTSYVELTFTAEAGRAYRLWLRGIAQKNHWANDSAHVQFSGSLDESGAAAWRIGTSDATFVNLEDAVNAGLSGWGWQDNGYGAGVLGPLVYFAASGPQTIRIQAREDGFSIDQIVLSSQKYLTAAPGALKKDSTILPLIVPSLAEIVLTASQTGRLAGTWRFLADTTAAGGIAVGTPDAGAAKVTTASATPADYVELTFDAEAGRPYRLWLRGRADKDHWANDSAHVQFSGSVDAAGAPLWRIGTTGGTWVNLEDGANLGLSGWGWQDNGYGAGVLGPLVRFATTGPQTIRIQTREDGFRIDQIVLSSEKYLTNAPGALKNDSTVLK